MSQVVLILLGGLMGSAVVFCGNAKKYQLPTRGEMQHTQNISPRYDVADKRAIKASRNSAVRVLSWDEKRGQMSVSTGTYFKYKEERYVVTVYHGILTPSCDNIQIEASGLLNRCSEIVHYDPQTDYAFLSVEEIPGRSPIRFPADFVRTRRGWLKAVSVLHPLLYTGYPNSSGPVTLSGKVMSFTDEEYIHFNSYAWSGSSGSGVFNFDGKYVGYIVAIDVGQTEYGVDVLENVILVVPHFHIDWTPILKR